MSTGHSWQGPKAGVSKVFAGRATFGEMNISGATFDHNTGRRPYSIHFMNQANFLMPFYDLGPHLAHGPDFGHAWYKGYPCLNPASTDFLPFSMDIPRNILMLARVFEEQVNLKQIVGGKWPKNISGCLDWHLWHLLERAGFNWIYVHSCSPWLWFLGVLHFINEAQ